MAGSACSSARGSLSPPLALHTSFVSCLKCSVDYEFSSQGEKLNLANESITRHENT
jgi:hypothetical protein